MNNGSLKGYFKQKVCLSLTADLQLSYLVRFVPGADVYKMFAYFRKNVGCSITDEELQYLAKNSIERARQERCSTSIL